MVTRIRRYVETDTGHRVPNHKSKCKHLHGHRYRFEAEIEGDVVDVSGVSDEGMLMDFAKCCHPIPGDTIVGALNAGKGVLVHRERCAMVRKLLRHPDQCISLRWDEGIESEFLVDVELEVLNKRGILAIVALAVSDAEGNVEDIVVKDRDGLNYSVVFTLLVKNRWHLASIMRSLRQVPEIIKIVRM